MGGVLGGSSKIQRSTLLVIVLVGDLNINIPAYDHLFRSLALDTLGFSSVPSLLHGSHPAHVDLILGSVGPET